MNAAVQPQMSDCREQLAALRQCGAHAFEPVRFHYLEQLAQRAQEQPERVRQILEARVTQALADWETRRAHTSPSATQPNPLPKIAASANAKLANHTPDIAAPTPLAALTHYLAQHAGASVQGGVHAELKSVRHFRNTWAKLSVDRQVAQALHQAPKNAGPINSHMLVLRSLGLMRDISPDYLNRFMTYVDTLLNLDHNERTQAAARADAAAAPGKKPRARTRRSGG